MLNALNTKLLIAILALLALIGGGVMYEHHQTAKMAAILEQQQQDRDRRLREDEAFRKRVEELKRKHSVAAGNESKTWTKYLP